MQSSSNEESKTTTSSSTRNPFTGQTTISTVNFASAGTSGRSTAESKTSQQLQESQMKDARVGDCCVCFQQIDGIVHMCKECSAMLCTICLNKLPAMSNATVAIRRASDRHTFQKSCPNCRACPVVFIRNRPIE